MTPEARLWTAIKKLEEVVQTLTKVARPKKLQTEKIQRLEKEIRDLKRYNKELEKALKLK